MAHIGYAASLRAACGLRACVRAARPRGSRPMGRRPALLLLLLGAAGAYDPQHCPLAVEFSCQDGQPAYSVCRDNQVTALTP